VRTRSSPADGLDACDIRPAGLPGLRDEGLIPLEGPARRRDRRLDWGAYLGDESKTTGNRAKVLLQAAHRAGSADPAGQGLGPVPQLDPGRRIESHKAGYEEAILLDHLGHVCEGSGENIFIVRDGTIFTPPQTASILDGVSRRSVMQIARDLGYEMVERDIGRAELYLADEVFMCGTAAELVPVREIDDHTIGDDGRPGEITRVLQRTYDDACNGRSDRYAEWLDVVPARAPA
jgi:branched-chain amino acid aminotransferase